MKFASAFWMFAVLFVVMGTTTSNAEEVSLNGHHFTLPDGFQIEEVCTAPLVLRPICADFDEYGRLYVADSSGSNAPVKEQLEEKPHRILCLEDTDGDHRFDTSTVFADQMMFPEGVLWHHGSLYVAAPPSIWKLTDTNHDGVADQREEWFAGKTLTGCANDLHGPYLGLDGWIYWCKGAFAEQTYEQPGKPPLVTRAAHLFRRHPTQGWIEPVMTGGMDNPVEVVFTTAGERFFTTTFLQHPGGGKRDGIIHAIYGGVYGKDHDVLNGHPRTGELMPVLTHLGPAAPCGLARLDSDGLGADYRGNLLACSFNMHKVTRHILQTAGASFTTEDHDLVVSDNVDFHPTDVLEDADGSVLVVDTGGWYKICCPTSHLYKPDILGAIYRIRRTDAQTIKDPRGLAMNWNDSNNKNNIPASALASRLDDPRWAVRRRAIAELADLGAASIKPVRDILESSSNAVARNGAIWTLARIDHADARRALRIAVNDEADDVRHAAIHALSLWRDDDAVEVLCHVLSTGVIADRRVAAEALGRIGDPAAVTYLLEASSPENDRVLEHSLIYALYEIGDAASLQNAAASNEMSPAARKAALIALDQLPGNQLSAKAIATLLNSDEPVLRDTAVWIADRHPEWAVDLAQYLREQLFAPDLDIAVEKQLETQLSRFALQSDVQQLIAEALANANLPQARRSLVLRAIRPLGFKELPAGWVSSIDAILHSDETQLITDAVSTLRSWRERKVPVDNLHAALIEVAERQQIEEETRLGALGALATTGELDASLLRFVVEQLQPQYAIERRLRAADILATAKLPSAEVNLVLEQVRQLGPMELGRLLPMFAEMDDDAVGHNLITALRDNPSIAGVPIPAIKANIAKFGPDVQQEASKLYAQLDAETANQQAFFEQLLTTLGDGDIRRGQAVFYGRKAACSSCHAIGYLGGDIGPDLTRIAQIRAPRDLLESIVFPSASFVRSFEPIVVVTVDGQIFNGVVRKDSADQIVIATGADKFETIARDEIEEIHPSKVSVMPAGLDKQLTRQELADLMAFLKESK